MGNISKARQSQQIGVLLFQVIIKKIKCHVGPATPRCKALCQNDIWSGVGLSCSIMVPAYLGQSFLLLDFLVARRLSLQGSVNPGGWVILSNIGLLSRFLPSPVLLHSFCFLFTLSYWCESDNQVPLLFVEMCHFVTEVSEGNYFLYTVWHSPVSLGVSRMTEFKEMDIPISMARKYKDTLEVI